MNLQDLINSPLEDIVIKKLLLSHDPDGRHLDSDHLLYSMQNIMLYATKPQDLFHSMDPHFGDNSNMEITNIEGSLAQTIVKISNEMLCNCSREENLHEKTMSLFDLLGNYTWGDKAVLALSALVKDYAEFWLLVQLYPKNPLAVSIAMLKQLPRDMRALSRLFKALRSLMNTVVDITKCIIEFENLPLSQVNMDDEAKSTRELHVYTADYWIIRSILTCSNKIANLTNLDQYSDSTIIATWELTSLVQRLIRMLNHLKKRVEECNQISEAKLYETLLRIFKEKHKENEQVLRMLFAFNDDFPLIDCPSQSKLGLNELENKVLILLISRPEFVPIDHALFLIQQHNTTSVEGSYETVWIPIPVSNSWTESEKASFRIMSHSLPWCSIKQPWLLSPAAVRFIRQAWNYENEPLMVVLDPNGNVTNFNAMDMVLIWGPRAFPFSASREEELWIEQKWTMRFLADEIDLLLTKWVEEDRYICIYGSNNVNWVLELGSKAKEIENSSELKLEMVYVGKKKQSTRESHAINNEILEKIEDGDVRSPLSLTKMQFFWLRLESIRRSKLRLGSTADTSSNDNVLQEASRLIEMDEKGEDWAVIGRGSSERVARVEGTDLAKFLDKYVSSSFEELNKLSVVDSEPCCDHESQIIKEEDHGEPIQAAEACEKCGHPMKKFFLYKPNDS